MEKGTPHCRLSVVRALVEAGQVRATFSALSGAAALGFDFEAMLGIVKALSTVDFHKSMTTHHDHRLWQDVYRPMTSAGAVYLKLTVTDGLLVVSFKEL
jgi:motility quorum-sensing regulator/GCU-specific mRNA interferase toxin